MKHDGQTRGRAGRTGSVTIVIYGVMLGLAAATVAGPASPDTQAPTATDPTTQPPTALAAARNSSPSPTGVHPDVATKFGRLAELIGEWRVQGRWTDGAELSARAEYSWTLDGRAIRVCTFVTPETGAEYQRYEGLITWSPERGALVQHSHAFDGSSEQLLITPGSTNGEFRIGFEPIEPSRPSRLRQMLQLAPLATSKPPDAGTHGANAVTAPPTNKDGPGNKETAPTTTSPDPNTQPPTIPNRDVTATPQATRDLATADGKSSSSAPEPQTKPRTLNTPGPAPESDSAPRALTFEWHVEVREGPGQPGDHWRRLIKAEWKRVR